MIDFVKLRIDNFDCSLLSTYEHIDNITTKYSKEDKGEAVVTNYEHKNIILSVQRGGYAEIKGSWHYYFNNGEHNYNDFTLNNFVEVTERLNQLFKINLWESRLMNLETGVNITPPVSTGSILNNLISHRKQMFSRQLDKGKKFYEAKHQRYYVKIYDKAIQNKIKDEILRFELKYVKMYDLNNNGIFTLSDLIKPESIKYLKERVVNELSQVLLFDPTIRINELTKLQRTQKIHQWANPNYWRGLTKTQTYKQGKTYAQIIKEYSEDVRGKLHEIIKEKLNVITQKGIPFNRPSKNQKGILINPLYSGLICHPQGLEDTANLPPVSEAPKEQYELTHSHSKDKIINKCKYCQSDISDFPRASYCNEKCRDDFELYTIVLKLGLNY